MNATDDAHAAKILIGGDRREPRHDLWPADRRQSRPVAAERADQPPTVDPRWTAHSVPIEWGSAR
jgi:hypothetical protein